MYSELHDFYIRNNHNRRSLNAHHALESASMMGLVPEFALKHVMVDKQHPYLKSISSRLNCASLTIGNNADQFFRSIQSHMKHRFGRQLSVREIENWVCKDFQV